jgi:hypothetical protein
MELSCLLYADDLVITSETKTGLQNALDKLQTYCHEWKLEINISKTKIMCVNNNDNHPFFINKQQLQRVSEFKYLGVLINNRGSNIISQTDLYHRALKVYFKILNSLNPLPNVKTLMHLFDHMVKPILLYNCEIWTNVNLQYRHSKHATVLNQSASFIASLRDTAPIVTKFIDLNHPAEKLHLKFCKRILGVQKYASNMAVYSELGRHPLFISQIIQCIRFYKHMENEDNKLLSDFWKNYDTKVMPLNNYKSFINQINVLTKFDNQSKQCGKVKHQLKLEFEQYWRKKINFNLDCSSKN